ncbi:hypothetical protein G7054_g6042 [Neopestalotiopsis clavispora]|nr:hypothetical protein G7054_g6042 [Neopestalotiopsis clavispora]
MILSRFDEMHLLLLLFSQILPALAEDKEAVDLVAIETTAAIYNGFSPRYFDSAFAPVPFAKRQDQGVCPNGGHRCEDIGASEACCGSNRYCYYKTDWEAAPLWLERPLPRDADDGRNRSAHPRLQRTLSATDCTDGGGCCLQGQTCVNVAGTPGCSGTPDGPAGSNTTTVDTGLSQSARAGIGAGVAIGAALVIGAVTWFCIRRRRRALTVGRQTEGRNTPGFDGATAAGNTMSETSVPVRNRVHRNGLGYEYLGPQAVVGPYTEQDTPAQYAGETHHDRGVAREPDGPGDIRRPVEIGASSEIIKDKDETHPGFGRTTSIRSENGINPQAAENHEVYELEAMPSPSPLSAEEFASAHSNVPGSPGGFNSYFISPEGTMRNDHLG